MRRCVLLLALVTFAWVQIGHAQDQPSKDQPGKDQPNESGRIIIARVAPVYPDLARRMNLEGIVKVRVNVAPDGSAKATEVLGGNPLLAKSAQDAISRWKWAPAPHESVETVQLRFHPPNRP